MLAIYSCAHVAPATQQRPPSDWIKTICVGGLEMEGCCSDTLGKNIAHLNPFFNELTAQYWVRHNSPSDYVGFFHYRRWLSFIPLDRGRSPEVSASEAETIGFVDNPNQRDFCLDLLDTYDIILPRRYFFPLGIRAQLFDTGMPAPIWDTFLQAIKVLQPKYSRMLEYFAVSQYAYMRNMYVASWEISCDYLDELFAVLDYVFERHFEEYKDRPSERRFCAFLAERYLTFWMHCNSLRIREVPLININEYKQIKTI